MRPPPGLNSPRHHFPCALCGAMIRAWQITEHAARCRGLARHRAVIADHTPIEQNPPVEQLDLFKETP